MTQDQYERSVITIFRMIFSKALFIFIPLACIAAMFVCFIPYKLDKEYPQILEDLEKRKTVNN